MPCWHSRFVKKKDVILQQGLTTNCSNVGDSLLCSTSVVKFDLVELQLKRWKLSRLLIPEKIHTLLWSDFKITPCLDILQGFNCLLPEHLGFYNCPLPLGINLPHLLFEHLKIFLLLLSLGGRNFFCRDGGDLFMKDRAKILIDSPCVNCLWHGILSRPFLIALQRAHKFTV